MLVADTQLTVRRGSGSFGRQSLAGWLFVAPVVILLGVFLFVPIIMAAWVSVADWTGRGGIFDSKVNFVGGDNYAAVLTGKGLTAKNFGMAIRNNLYYVLFVVPLQTAISLALATLVSRKALKAKGFFRTAFYFPSVTSTIAITVLWVFLFNGSGTINKLLSYLSITGPNWFNDPRGVFSLMTGTTPGTEPFFLNISLGEWLAGPSIAMSAYIMMAVFTTSGTFMLLFLAALQNIGEETDEAAMIDGANTWQRFRHVTLPMLRPTLFTVITLGLIGSWQVFDQIYAGPKNPTTTTPAYLAYNVSFGPDGYWGRGAAIAFVLFAIIMVMTAIQRWILGDADFTKLSRRQLKAQHVYEAGLKARREQELAVSSVVAKEVTHG